MSDINDVVIIANQMNLALSICSYRLEQIDEKLAEQNEILKQGLITIALCIKGGNENGKKES
ncbi:MAG: hypothetical protein MJ172_04580 [Clostridia bacterium]|nr:hypothetical protein [Clostridia bacterium]